MIISIDNLYNESCTEIRRHHCSIKPFHYKSALIKRRQSYDTAKTVSFSYRNDLTITLFEGNNIGEEPKPIFQFNVTGINSVSERNNATPKVALRFELDSRGIIDLVQAKAIYERSVQHNVTANASANGNKTDNATNATVVEKIEKVEEKFPLTISKINFYPLPLSEKQFTESKAKLQLLDDKELKERKRAEAKSNYESLIYSSRDWLRDEKNQMFIEEKFKESVLTFLDQVLKFF